MARRDAEAAKVRRMRMIIAAVLSIAAGVVVLAGLYSIYAPSTDLASGDHYTRLPAAERPRRGEIVVTEYFSYGCVHCRNFDPQIEDWKSELPDGVRFERVPVVFSGAWRALGAAYYAAGELDVRERNHTRLFDAIHRDGLVLQTPEALAGFFDGHGTDGERFRRAMGSPTVTRALADATDRARTDGITSVPTLVVDGRYRLELGTLSRRELLEAADALIAEELAARRGGAEPASGP